MCVLIFMEFKTPTDLVILEIEKFYIILGMSWLFPYHTILGCFAKTIIVVILEMGMLVGRYF